MTKREEVKINRGDGSIVQFVRVPHPSIDNDYCCLGYSILRRDPQFARLERYYTRDAAIMTQGAVENYRL